MKSAAPIAFKRLIVLHNPGSSNAAKAQKLISALRKTHPPHLAVAPTGQTETENLALLKDLRAGDVVALFGGDGTISSFVDLLYHPSLPKRVRRAVFLPIGTGRMNDVARMLNGRHASSPLYALKHGRVLAVYPLECRCTPLGGKGQPLIKRVIYSVGFGYSGTCSLVWNDPAFRAKVRTLTPVTRTVEFFKMGTGVLKEAEYFDITSERKRRPVLEVMIANGHMIGGYYRLPTRLSQREFYLTISDDKSFLGTVRTIAELVTNRFAGGQSVAAASFVLHDPVIAQLGGEPFTPPAPCEVTISLCAEPIRMLATNPKA